MSQPDAEAAEEAVSRAEFLGSIGRSLLVAIAAFAVGYSVDWVWARLVRGARLEREGYPTAVLAGWRMHHNVVGYLLVVAGVFRMPLALIPAGIGMIVGHRRRDRLWWFLERVR
jgi:hypothetical protein